VRPINRISARTLLCGALAVWLAGAGACDRETPTAAGDHPPTVDPSGPRDFYIASVPLEDAPEVRVDAWGQNLAVESDTVVSFDLVIVNRSDRTIYPPAQVELIDIAPDVVTVLNPDSHGPALDSIVFFLMGHMGDDDRLDPGEATNGIHIRFGMPGLMSFSLGLRVEGRLQGPESISGVVFDDVVTDGTFDPALEVGLPRLRVEFHSTPEPGGIPPIAMTTVTDPSGRYVFSDLRAGVYSVRAYGPEGWTSTSPNPRLVTLVEGPDGELIPATGVDFGFFNPTPSDSGVIYHADVRAGTEHEDDFVNPPSSSDQRYFLSVTDPIYIRAPVGAITGSQVWINDTPVWEVHCDPADPLSDCPPPPVDRRDAASIDFRVVDGWGEPFWIYTIWRLPAPGTP